MGQAFPHAPQWATSVCALTSQPLAAAPSQSAKPPAQALTAQLPMRQKATALGRPQRLSHTPQLTGLAIRSTQAPPQQVSPPGHALDGLHPATHAPPAQSLPLGQSPSATHCTHSWRDVSQRSAAAPPSELTRQPSSERQPSAQESVAGSQCLDGGQVSAVGTQPTQRPVRGVADPAVGRRGAVGVAAAAGGAGVYGRLGEVHGRGCVDGDVEPDGRVGPIDGDRRGIDDVLARAEVYADVEGLSGVGDDHSGGVTRLAAEGAEEDSRTDEGEDRDACVGAHRARRPPAENSGTGTIGPGLPHLQPGRR